MKITVVRSGGIAGISTSWEVTIDDRDDREAWLGLIEQLPWGAAAQAKAEPDRYSYSIRCARRRVTIAEQQLTGPWRDLVERVQNAAGESRRP